MIVVASMVGWVASHTGLASFYLVGPGSLVADGTRRVATVGDGEMVFVADPAGQIGGNVSYSFAGASVTLKRVATQADAPFLLTDMVGRQAAPVRVVGDDGRDHDLGVAFSDGAARYPTARYRPNAPSPTGSLDVLTDATGTALMRGLARERRPLWVVHNLLACQLPGCDFGASRLIQPTRMSESRSGRRDRAHRRWSLQYRELDRSMQCAAPVFTWAEMAARAPGWWGSSWVDVARQVSGMPS